jgi:uncharacterized tellurite resistance protein B-like protein
MINQEDIYELKRLATNTYENDKAAQIHRIIHGINSMNSELIELRNQNAEYKRQLAAKKN